MAMLGFAQLCCAVHCAAVPCGVLRGSALFGKDVEVRGKAMFDEVGWSAVRLGVASRGEDDKARSGKARLVVVRRG